jgi:hypothetical protein
MFHRSLRALRNRHPLARLALGLLGALAALLLVALGLAVLVALAIGGGALLLFNAWRPKRSGPKRAASAAPPPPRGVIEGEFEVVASAPVEPSAAAR